MGTRSILLLQDRINFRKGEKMDGLKTEAQQRFEAEHPVPTGYERRWKQPEGFLDPQEFPPPKGSTVIIYTSGNTVILGPWRDHPFYLLWMPRPQPSRELLDKVRERWGLWTKKQLPAT
jgi:hypothetical protein